MIVVGWRTQRTWTIGGVGCFTPKMTRCKVGAMEKYEVEDGHAPKITTMDSEVVVDEATKMWVCVEELNFYDEKCTHEKMSAVIGDPTEFSQGVE